MAKGKFHGVISAATPALRASARASAPRARSRWAARARAKADATASRSVAGAVTTTSDWSWGERLSIVAVLMGSDGTVPAVDITITGVDVRDVRFPTSRTLAGSDAMNAAPDYSVAYVVLATDSGLQGHGMTFTIGRGTEVVVTAIHALEHLVVGLRLADVVADPGRFWRTITGDSQLRWIGPEKGVIHLATAALVNAVWDLWAKAEGKPLWKLVCDME